MKKTTALLSAMAFSALLPLAGPLYAFGFSSSLTPTSTNPVCWENGKVVEAKNEYGSDELRGTPKKISIDVKQTDHGDGNVTLDASGSTTPSGSKSYYWGDRRS